MNEKNKSEDMILESGTHKKRDLNTSPFFREMHRSVSDGGRKIMAPLAAKVNAPFSNKTKATNRQKPRKRK